MNSLKLHLQYRIPIKIFNLLAIDKETCDPYLYSLCFLIRSLHEKGKEITCEEIYLEGKNPKILALYMEILNQIDEEMLLKKNSSDGK